MADQPTAGAQYAKNQSDYNTKNKDAQTKNLGGKKNFDDEQKFLNSVASAGATQPTRYDHPDSQAVRKGAGYK